MSGWDRGGTGRGSACRHVREHGRERRVMIAGVAPIFVNVRASGGGPPSFASHQPFIPMGTFLARLVLAFASLPAVATADVEVVVMGDVPNERTSEVEQRLTRELRQRLSGPMMLADADLDGSIVVNLAVDPMVGIQVVNAHGGSDQLRARVVGCIQQATDIG